MIIKEYNKLPKEAIQIREEVFIKEQKFENEFDAIDTISKHLVLFFDNKAVATCRFYQKEDIYYIGRVAVLKEYRNKRLGKAIFCDAEDRIKKLKGKIIRVHSQKAKKAFYEKEGYLVFGSTDYDEEMPHVWMEKDITTN